jgi:phage tail sheath protein FI
MAVYLSPGVFTREIDLNVLPSAVGPLRPGFVGTAKKGPLNEATLITGAQQYIETFGTPFPESPLGYAVLAYLEEGDSCFVMRVGVEAEEGQADSLADVAIDISGERSSGWGRIPLFSGIDYGRINLREVDEYNPMTFHAASVGAVDYNDVDESDTNGPTTATLDVTGTYTGDVDDSFILLITGAPTVSSGASVDGAEFQIIRNSDGEILVEGDLVDDDHNGTSQVIDLGNGLSVQVIVTDGVLEANDTFSFAAAPDNRKFTVAVEGDVSPTEYTMPSASYDNVTDFVDAVNALLSSEDYIFVEYTMEDGETVIPQIRTETAGERIQLMGTAGWALEVGSQQYAWDIPRSYLLGVDPGPYDITSQNNRVKMMLIGDTESPTVEFNVPTGLGQTVANVADAIDAAGVVAGETYWESFELTVPGETTHVVIVTSTAHQLDTLQLMATYSSLKTLRFAEELDFPYPYKRAYRGFRDNRLTLPASGESDASTPLSCEDDPASDECASDTAYFQNVVGWFVAPSPGTWVDDYTVSVESYTESVTPSGRYKITIKDNQRVPVDVVEDVSFDKLDDRYVGAVLNPGSKHGGRAGNAYLNWEERPAFLNNNVNEDDYAVRYPSQFTDREFLGQANGIPTDPAYSSELDAAVIGNAATSTGLYAFQNPESIDINILCTPGFSTGAVIGTALQICESRGDVIYLVDPPFGLRPQQVVDWHNGMLLSDLRSAINSSYGALYYGWIRVFDQFSSDEIWIPPSGHIAAVYSRTARDAEMWFAPAGLRRGRLLTALDVEYSPSKGERDLLYGSGNSVNPITKFPQDGIVVWGQKTLQRSSSPLQHVNVRMLCSSLKKGLGRMLRDFIFEPNDRVLWRQVFAVLDPYMADVQARRGLSGYKIVIDETNNTPERVDRNELWVSIFIKPTPTVEFIALNLVVLRTGASFSAEEVLAAGGIITGASSI